jgi:hypothetical protein
VSYRKRTEDGDDDEDDCEGGAALSRRNVGLAGIDRAFGLPRGANLSLANPQIVFVLKSYSYSNSSSYSIPFPFRSDVHLVRDGIRLHK